MPTHVSHHGQVYDLADGDQTVGSLIAAVGLFPMGKVEVRCETPGPIAVAVRSTALTALAQGKQLSEGDNATFEDADLSLIRIFAVGTADKVYIEVRTF